MSRLPNAPLLEVIFELRWNSSTTEELQKWQYLHGDLYSLLKDNYPHRELIVPAEMPIEMLIGNPIHRFRPSPKTYPLVQLGPGVLTVNTIDKNYFWEDYMNNILDVTTKFLEIHPLGSDIDLSLQYYDFFEFPFEKSNILEFLSKKLKINIQQDCYQSQSNLSSIDLGLSYKVRENILSIILNRGSKNNVEGIILRTIVKGDNVSSEIQNISKWVDDSHRLTSSLFKDMTEGELYQSFAQNKL